MWQDRRGDYPKAGDGACRPVQYLPASILPPLVNNPLAVRDEAQQENLSPHNCWRRQLKCPLVTLPHPPPTPSVPPQVVSVSGSGAWIGQVWEGRLQTWKLALTQVVLWSTCWLVSVPSKACFFNCPLDPREHLIMLSRKASGSLARVDQGRLGCLKKT